MEIGFLKSKSVSFSKTVTFCQDSESFLDQTCSRQVSCASCELLLGFFVCSASKTKSKLIENYLLILDNIHLCENEMLLETVSLPRVEEMAKVVGDKIETTREVFKEAKKIIQDSENVIQLCRSLLHEYKKFKKELNLQTDLSKSIHGKTPATRLPSTGETGLKKTTHRIALSQISPNIERKNDLPTHRLTKIKNI